MTETISAGRILSQTAILLKRGASRAAAALAVLASLSILIDSGAVSQSNGSGLNLLLSGASTAAAYWITKSLLQDVTGRLLPARFPAFFGLGLLSGIGILLGLVLLIVPGIVLLVRWSVSDAILLSSEDSVTESMQRSWSVTGPHFWPILVALLALYGPALLITGAVLAISAGWAQNLVAVIVSDFCFNLALIAGWHAAVAIFTLLEAPDRLAETFA